MFNRRTSIRSGLCRRCKYEICRPGSEYCRDCLNDLAPSPEVAAEAIKRADYLKTLRSFGLDAKGAWRVSTRLHELDPRIEGVTT
jgi:predicted amidophosphoribosyltransferase